MADLAALVGWDVLAAILWSLLALSLGASIWGLARWSWWPLLGAAVLSFVFSASAILSIGPLTLLLTLLQLAGAVALRVAATWARRIIVLLGGVLVWIALIGRVLIPWWFAH